MQIVGILNLTRDSFSDGGRFLDPARAIEHGLQLARDGAALVDVGAESSNPDGEDVPAREEIARLEPVVNALKAEGVSISVDTCKAPVMERALELGADMINDITALGDPRAVDVLRDARARVVIMHSRAARARAERRAYGVIGPAGIRDWLGERVAGLEQQGIARERLVVDPGMGFFLGQEPGPSLEVLAHLEEVRVPGLPLMVSTSRKSFIGSLTGRSPAERSHGSLATEIWAGLNGADLIRTHDVRALADAWRLIEGIREAGAR